MIYFTQMESLNEHWLIMRSCNLKHVQYVNMIAHKKISKKKKNDHKCGISVLLNKSYFRFPKKKERRKKERQIIMSNNKSDFLNCFTSAINLHQKLI